MNLDHPIVLFDGVCSFCNASVDFIARHDPKIRIKFASLQSDFAKKLLAPTHINPETLDSIVLVLGDKVYQKSSAVLKIASYMNGPWPLAKIFFLVPTFVRDFVYDIIARNRYRWFGKRDTCRVPTPEERTRFLG